MKLQNTLLVFVFTTATIFNFAFGQATPWPNRAIKIIVPFVPGSFTDSAARVLSVELSSQLGQPVIVDNKGGAGSTLGTDFVAKSSPDGYTFLLTDNSFVVSAALYDKLPYQPLKDLMPITTVAESPAVIVARPGLGVKELKDVVAYLQKNPNGLTYGSGGIGSSAHLAMEAFLTENNLKMVHIPFKGIAAAITEVVADRVDLAIGSVGSAQANIKDARLIGLAVSGPQRSALLPGVPTFAQAGYPSYKMMYWFGIFAPQSLSKEIAQRMQREVAHALTQVKVLEVFNAAGVKAVSNSLNDYAIEVHDDVQMWSDVVKKANLKSNLN